MRTRKLAGLGKKIWEAPPVVLRGSGHWLAGATVTPGSVTDLLCDLGWGVSRLGLPYLNLRSFEKAQSRF